MKEGREHTDMMTISHNETPAGRDPAEPSFNDRSSLGAIPESVIGRIHISAGHHAPFLCGKEACVHRDFIPLDNTIAAELGENISLHSLEDVVLVPIAEPLPACRRAWTLVREVLPSRSGLENPGDIQENHTIVCPGTTALRWRGCFGKQWLKLLSLLVDHDRIVCTCWIVSAIKIRSLVRDIRRLGINTTCSVTP